MGFGKSDVTPSFANILFLVFLVFCVFWMFCCFTYILLRKMYCRRFVKQNVMFFLFSLFFLVFFLEEKRKKNKALLCCTFYEVKCKQSEMQSETKCKATKHTNVLHIFCSQNVNRIPGRILRVEKEYLVH